jgi:hypothetical protein
MVQHITTESGLRWYAHSAQFPKRAFKAIPTDMTTLIDGGSAGFFAGIEAHFPVTFAALLEKPPIQLLERAISRTTGMGEQAEDHLYAWAVPLSETRRLIARIPAFGPSSPVRQRAQAKFLPRLPPEFAVFYQHSDGMTISDGSGLSGYDFPQRSPGWLLLTEYYRQRGFSRTDARTVMKELSSDDLRVVMSLRNGGFVFCNMKADGGTLYLVREGETGTARPIPNTRVFDTYFAQCLREPENQRIALCGTV